MVNVTIGHIITKTNYLKVLSVHYYPDDMMEWEEYCNNHPAVKAEIAKLKLPSGYSVRNDPWIYATDDANETRPLIQFYMYVLAEMVIVNQIIIHYH